MVKVVLHNTPPLLSPSYQPHRFSKIYILLVTDYCEQLSFLMSVVLGKLNIHMKMEFDPYTTRPKLLEENTWENSDAIGLDCDSLHMTPSTDHSVPFNTLPLKSDYTYCLRIWESSLKNSS
ncbi:uncharacterized protein LOC144216064 [Crocuta crocuta]